MWLLSTDCKDVFAHNSQIFLFRVAGRWYPSGILIKRKAFNYWLICIKITTVCYLFLYDI